MARRISVEIIGDTRSLERSFQRAGSSATHFSRDLDRTFRGALSGTAVFHGLGRSVAFASAQFLGAAGFVAVLKSTVSAAVENQRVLGQTEAAVNRSGQSWARYGKRVEQATTAQSNLSGFSTDDLLKSFTQFDRATGDVTKSLSLNALAIEVARGKGKDLAVGTQVVTKALLGQAGSVTRLTGIALPKAASSYQILTALQDKFAGSSEAFNKTTAGGLQQFQNALRNTQVSLGTQLLPTLNTYLDSANTWLSSSKNQATLQRDLKTVVDDTSTVVRQLASGAEAVSSAFGGLKNTAEILIGLKVASTISRWAKSFIELRTAILAAKAAGKGGIISSAASRFVPASVAVGTFEAITHAKQIQNATDRFFDRHGLGGLTGDRSSRVSDTATPAQIRAQANQIRNSDLAKLSPEGAKLFADVLDKAAVARAKQIAGATAGKPIPKAVTAPATGSTGFNAALFRGASAPTFGVPVGLQVAAARAAASKTLADDKAAAEAIRNYARKAIASGNLKGKELIAAFNALADANAKLTSLLTKATFTVPIGLQVAAAKAGTTKTERDDRATASAIKAFAEKQIKSGKLRGQALIDAFNTITQANSTISQQVQEAAFTVPVALQIQAAKAGTTKTEADDLRAAKAIRSFTERAIRSGKVKGQALVDAFNTLAQLNQQINDTLNQKIDQFRSQFGSLFQGPVIAPTDEQRKRALGVPGPSPSKLTADLRAQNAAFAAEQRDLARLRRRGAPAQLITELEQQGPAGAQFVHSLATASSKALNAFLKQFAIREKQITKAAHLELRANTVTLHATRVNVTGAGGKTGGSTVNYNGPITVVTKDPADFERKLQKKAKGNATQRRGRNAGVNLGLA